MTNIKKLGAVLLAASLLVTIVPLPETVHAKGSTKNTKYYTISKKPGNYTSAISVTVRAKKGYHVYYKTSGKFKKKNLIMSGKSKNFKIKKSLTLSLCAVKKTKTVSNHKLNKTFAKKKTAYYAKYKYRISKTTDTKVPSFTDSGTISRTASPSITMTPSATALSTAAPSLTAAPPSLKPTPSNSNHPGNISSDSEEKNQAQTILNETETLTSVNRNIPEKKVPVTVTKQTAAVTLMSDGIKTENLMNDEVTYEERGNLNILTICKSGTYILKGGSVSDPVTNTQIVVAANLADEVHLIWDHLFLDNHMLGKESGEDGPVFYVGESTPDVHVTIKGKSSLTGNGAYKEKPAAALICAEDTGTTLTFTAYEDDPAAELTVIDAMDSGTDFHDLDPSDGIYSKGTLVFESGVYSVTANGDCIKGTGKKGKGGILIHDGSYTLCSNYSNALKSKNGNIIVHGGTIYSTYTGEDGINAKNYEAAITGGTIMIDQCYGDGIQGENVSITGDETVVDIVTYYKNAGVNYYNPDLGSGHYNTMTSTNSSKTEVVHVDTGSHKGIKGGTKAKTYSYKTVEEGSDHEAGTTYTEEASGGIVITGGKISIDTTNTGIKYNGQGGGPGFGNRSGGTLTAANSDGQYIIGSPDDGIHSNNTCVITGGDVRILSSDDGITGPTGVILMNDCDITIQKCYEGIEGGEIIIGSSEGSDTEPAVKIYSDDDGINAASKASINYSYQDESETVYTKTETASKNNTLKVLGGYINVMIADDQEHSFSLPAADGTTTTGSYTSDGDGIDCNGSFYAYEGTFVILGANSNANSPIDTDGAFYIESGVTLLATGKSGMAQSPTAKDQPILVYGTTGGFGPMRPGPGGSGTETLSANTVFAIQNEEKTILAIKPVKNYNYVLYSSPELEKGASYTLYSGGSVSGSLLWDDSEAYECRYSEYDASGATVLKTQTAQG